jgi:hypothetical protein
MSKVIPLKPKQQSDEFAGVELRWGRFPSESGFMQIFVRQVGHKVEFTCRRTSTGRELSEEERTMRGIGLDDVVWIVYGRAFMAPGRLRSWLDSLFKPDREQVIIREARRFVARVRRDVLWMDREQSLNSGAMERLRLNDNPLRERDYGTDWSGW